MNEPIMTVVGNLTADPELRFTPSGAAVVNFTVASTPRKKVPNSDEWEDGEAVFLKCSAWRDMAENIAESLQKGHRVIVTGRFKVETYQRKDGGGTGTSLLLDVDEVGHSLRWGSSKFTKTQGGEQQRQPRGQGRQGSGRPSQGRPPQGDPWGGDPWAGAPPLPEEPPF